MKFFIDFLDKILAVKIERSIFVIDKKAGRTSHDEVYFLRNALTRALGKKFKTGHSGTLDPKVTGVLVCGTGKATKALEYILLSKKEYVAEFIFHKEVKREVFAKVVKKFLGKITQLPPVKSSVKRIEREREIYDLDILTFSDDGRYARVFCSVEKGTYIRKLAHDMGELMGITTSMGEMKRVRAGVFSYENSRAVSIKKIENILDNFSRCKKCWIKKIIYYFIFLWYRYSLEEMFLRLEREGVVSLVYVEKKSVKYIEAGNSVRLKNIVSTPNQVGEKTSEKPIAIFYKKPYDIFTKGRLLAVGEYIKKETNTVVEKKSEQEVIRLKKVF